MSSKTEDIFYLNDRYRTLVDNREEMVAGIRRDGWCVVGIIALVYGTLMLLLILQRNSMPLLTEGFSNIILLQVIVMLMAILLLGVPYRYRARLFEEGEILKGTIDTITVSQDRGRAATMVKYHFQTMLGETLEGAINVVVDHQLQGRSRARVEYFFQIVFSWMMQPGKQPCWLDNTDGKGLPEAGTTVAVLYRTNKHHLIL